MYTRILALTMVLALAAVLARLVEGSTDSEVTFVEAGQQLNPLAGRGVALADFNGDGNLDAFVVNRSSADGAGNRVYFGDGHGKFGKPLSLVNSSDSTGRPAVADIDGNGTLDVVTGDTVWVNDGRGHFTSHPEAIDLSDPAQLGIVRLADVNGDGYPDLVAIAGGTTLRVYLNDGHGRFRDTRQRLGAGMIGALALADVDGDGAVDAVTGGWRNDKKDPCPNRVWLNDGKGNFHDSGQVFDQGNNHVQGVALGDLDNDGRPDLVLAMTAPGRAGKVYHNDGNGRFSDTGQSIGHRGTNAVVLGDFDGDGALDLLLVCGEPATGTPNEVWLNDGHAVFHDSGLRLGSAFSWDAAVGDLNGDSRPDVFVVNLRVAGGSKTSPVFGGEAAEVWLNTTLKPPKTAAMQH